MPHAISNIVLIVATKGRPEEAAYLLNYIGKQDIKPDKVVFVGSSQDDVANVLAGAPYLFDVNVVISDTAGITVQRNNGIRRLISHNTLNDNSLVIFFDDDFRPAQDWIGQCFNLMNKNDYIAGLTGSVLADGAQSGAIDEDRAKLFLDGKIPPMPHWASGALRETESVYGCNMAFRGSILKNCKFDENLPLYSWQEDRDMTGQASAFGCVLFVPACRGVHLGSKGGRTSGLRFGYSQIANMFYMFKKGTTSSSQLRRFVIRSFASNVVHSIYTRKNVDYRGRLRGNLKAISDVIRGRVDPRRILEL